MKQSAVVKAQAEVTSSIFELLENRIELSENRIKSAEAENALLADAEDNLKWACERNLETIGYETVIRKAAMAWLDRLTSLISDNFPDQH
jgi:hypothetical protein